jgi:predicted nucleotidyltransferase
MAVSRIIEYLNHQPQVSAAWLFGSVAQGRAHQDSDIDLAILFVPGLTKEQRFNLKLKLAVELTELAGRETDIVDMVSAASYLQHQVRKTGRLLLEKDHQYRVTFDVESRRTYFDLAPSLAFRNRRLFERATGGDLYG